MFFPCFAAGAAETLQISMPDVVRVEGDACSLSEVADISGPRVLANRAGELLLTIENGVITREQVISALRVSGLESVRVELRMPSAVRVEKGTRESGPSFRETDRGDLAELVKYLAAWDGEVEVQHQGGVPAGRLVAPASIVPGTSAATLRFRDDWGAERSLAVRLIWTQPVLVLTRSLRRGEVLKETDVMVRQIRVNRPGVYVSKFADVAGRTVTKNISQGEALTFNLLTNAPIIERGKGV
ncbi:MAG: flagella basal body P-ring formation protein FlgA, partial [Synergistaceae bacterium]|nr:flagella basal body P-ring formation protein FlgA [Synergistaceae bacterium]